MTLTNSTRRKLRVRGKIASRNKSLRPKIVVFRSNKNIYAQLVDVTGKVLVSFSTLSFEDQDSKTNGLEKAKLVGENFAKLCLQSDIKEVVFDKGEYNYNGRVKALANACRDAGLIF
jgi:large subunit ribosomal protein L18